MSNKINIGGVTVDRFYLGNDTNIKIFLGTTKLYPNTIKDYLKTVARGTGEISLTIGSAVTTTQMTSIAYSLDGNSWTTANNVDGQTVTLTTPTLASGDAVYWKGVGVQTAIAAPSLSGGRNSATIFSSDVNFDVEGNAMSMLYDDNFEDEEFDSGSTYHLTGLFYSSTNLVGASGMTLPATTVCENDYNDMFNGCSNLLTPPELPATTIGASCYKRMFQGCTSLSTSPELLSTTLAAECYRFMFQNCTSLIAAPQISATTMNGNQNCDSMFQGCTSLTTAPSVLPATTLTVNCYRSMFQNCTSLTSAPELPATTLAYNCYQHMFQGCTSLTTAPSLPATTLTDFCYGYMFQGCTSLTTAPSLPATTLAYNCYQHMFQGCTSLTTAPSLPATTLAYNCYQYMFQGCSSLNRIECNADTYYRSATSATYNWVSGVAASGKFIKNSSNTWWTTGNSGIPTNWSVGTLPAERTDWVKAETTDYACVGYDKHYKEYLEETTDGGITWSYVTPLSSRTSEDVIEYDSIDCGYVPPVANYFKITSLAANNTITLRNNRRTSSASTFSYSTDNGTTWSSFSLTSGQTQTIATINSGDTILMYGDNQTLGSNYNTGHYFRATGDYEISGEISSLVNGNATDTDLSGKRPYTFAMLFSGDTHLISAENLKISSEAIPASCFNSAFRGCTNLVKAPTTLPSTILGREAYSSMFEGCTSLSQPPEELYFTSADISAYNRMFCMSRTSMVASAMEYTPKLFGNWASTAPSAQQMFCGNGNLTDIYCYWTNTSGSFSGSSCLENWVNYTADSGVTFRKRSTQTFASGVNGIKTGWTVINDDTTQPS